jgi:hypothetical protein
VGRGKRRKHHPSRCIMVVKRKKSIAFMFLCSLASTSSQPTLRLFRCAKEAISARRKVVRGNRVLLENVFKPGDRINW